MSLADIAIYGGAAGGGKSFALAFDAARYYKTPGYSAIIFRRTRPELTGGGSIWEETTRIYPHIGGKPTEHRLLWRFASGAQIQLSHLQHPQDVRQHQSKQYAGIYFDELAHFTRDQWNYLLSRARSTCGIRPRIRAGTNPAPDSWLLTEWLDWWIDPDSGYPIEKRSGVLRWFVRVSDELVWSDSEDELQQRYPELQPLSFTFIAAKLDDNKILMQADPSYQAKLLALPQVERLQLLKGNWHVTDHAGMFFRPEWFDIVDAAPAHVAGRVRAWDKAATRPSQHNPDPSWTAGLKMSRDLHGGLVVEDVVRLRDGPLGVERAIHNTASQDSKACKIALWRDPGQAGKVDVANMARLLAGYSLQFEATSSDKETFAKPLSSQAEAGNVRIVKGPWNKAFIDELHRFPHGKHDDQVDAASLGCLCLTQAKSDWLKRMLHRRRSSG